MDCILEQTLSTLRVARLEMDAEVVRKENSVEGGSIISVINGDQENGAAKWKALRNTIFLVVKGGVVTGSSDK